MKSYELPEQLILNYRKWVCGFFSVNGSDNGVGNGDSMLLNSNNEMCCLGQWMEQSGVCRSNLRTVGEPLDVFSESDISVPTMIKSKDGYMLDNSSFSKNAMRINDDDQTSVAQKAYQLISLCKKYNRELGLVNFPKKVIEEINEIGRENLKKRGKVS